MLHLIEGPVGAGKSTFARELSARHKAPHLNLDEWMVTLFRPDRPSEGFMAWYADRKARCIEQIWNTACAIEDAGSSVVLELGLVQSSLRNAFYARAEHGQRELTVYVLDVPREERWRRVQQRNDEQSDTFRMEVSEEIFQIADAAWEPPDEIELQERAIRRIRRE